MSIKKLNHHYSMENPASVYDEEAMTALELAGRTTAKVNECVEMVNGLGEAVEAFDRKVEGYDDTLNTFVQNAKEDLDTHMENQEKALPATVTAEIKEQLASGALNHVVIEHTQELEDRLDNLLSTVEEGETTRNAEILDARLGNGGVTYETLGEAIRHQTAKVKPVRLYPEGGEWRKDEMEAPGYNWVHNYFTLSGFTMTTEEEQSFSTFAYEVKPGHDYVYTCGNAISLNEILNGFFIFVDDESRPVIGGTNLDKYIKCTDTKNHVYRIRIPDNCAELYCRYYSQDVDKVELWEVVTNTNLAWLTVNSDNIEGNAVTPAHLDRKTGPWFRNVDYAKTLHSYKVASGNGITDATTTGIALVTIPDVMPGEQYRIPVGKDVSASLHTYFVFEGEDESTGAIPSAHIGEYVELVDGSNYVYLVTIPDGCTKFHTACDVAVQPLIQEHIEYARIPWLQVTEENLDPAFIDGVKEEVMEAMEEELGNIVTGPVETVAHSHQSYDLTWPTYFTLQSGYNRKCVVYGDSISNGYSAEGETLSNPYYDAFTKNSTTVTNRSVNGYTLADVATLLAEDTTLNYNYVVINAGINDYRAQRAIGSYGDTADMDTVHGSVRAILDTILNATKKERRLLFILPIDIAEVMAEDSIPLDEYRKAIYEECVGQLTIPATGTDTTYITVVDGGTFGFPKEPGGLANVLFADNLHPSAKGYTLFSNKLAQKMLY